MSQPTWGIYIPGYSYPSSAQKRKFERMYPGATSMYLRERAERDRDEKAARKKMIEEERRAQAACNHRFVYTNLKDYYICQVCRMHIDSHPDKNPRVIGHQWSVVARAASEENL